MAENFDSAYKLVFFSLLILLGLLEQVSTLRRQPVQRDTRWVSNISLFLVNGVLVRIALPVSIIAFAKDQPPGMLARLGLGLPAQFLLTFLVLDLWRYWEHRLLHQVPVLWRAHLVHHSDTGIDVTTSERHHPFESLLGAALLLTWVAILGLPAEALGLYLVVAIAVALFSHANLRLPTPLDRWRRLLIVTPALHAVHHSASRVQTNSNYSNLLTVWDRLFGTYADPDKNSIRHTGLEYFHLPQDTGPWRVLLQPFLFRKAAFYPAPIVSPLVTTPVATQRTEWERTLLGALAGSALVLLVMWPTILSLVTSWQGNEAYRYGWLVMPMVIYLLGWHFRDELLASNPQPDLWGVLMAAIAAIFWGASSLMAVDVASQFALVLALQGIAMSALGWRLYARLFPVLALMFLMVPGGDVLQAGLRLLTLKSIELFATVAGLPHRIDGFSVAVAELRYVVVDACSGLSYVTLTLFLGYCFGLLLFRSVLKVAALALLAAGLGVLSNVIRVNGIVLTDWVQGSQMDLAAHGTLQWVGLCVALGLLFYVLAQLKPDPAPITPPGPSLQPLPNRLVYFPAVAGLMALLIAGIAAWVPSNALRSPYGAQTGWLPQTILDWTLITPVGPWVVDKPGEIEALAATYQHKGQAMQVMVIETLAANAKLPDSRLTPLERESWHDVRAQKETSCVALKCVTLLHTTWQRGAQSLPRHVYYAYNIGSFSTDSRLALRAAQGWNRLVAGPHHPQLIGLTFEGEAPAINHVASVYLQILTALNDFKR